MRIAELSRQSGVPVPTIKYYLRENLLPPGELTSPTQARYGERHVQRLRLIRALVDIARLPIATIREVLCEIDQPDPVLHYVLGRVMKSTLTPRGQVDPDRLTAAEQKVDEMIARRGWQVSAEAPARQAVAEVLATLAELGVGDLGDALDEYAEAAERIAEADLATVSTRENPEELVYAAVVGTIIGDRLHSGLRRLAHENASATRFALGAPPPPDC